MMLFATGFNEAFMGVGTQFNKELAVYSKDKVIKILMGNGDMTQDEAVEYFEFNVQGAWVGEGTPMFLEKMSVKEAREQDE
jgi:hypothetical protein